MVGNIENGSRGSIRPSWIARLYGDDPIFVQALRPPLERSAGRHIEQLVEGARDRGANFPPIDLPFHHGASPLPSLFEVHKSC
jgi:hypothetical protein